MATSAGCKTDRKRRFGICGRTGTASQAKFGRAACTPTTAGATKQCPFAMPNRNSKPWRDRNKRDRPGRGAILFGWPQTVQICGLGGSRTDCCLDGKEKVGCEHHWRLNRKRGWEFGIGVLSARSVYVIRQTCEEMFASLSARVARATTQAYRCKGCRRIVFS